MIRFRFDPEAGLALARTASRRPVHWSL